MNKSKVYFISNITSDNIVKMYEVLNKELKGKVAVKVHSGEKGNKNYLHPEFLKKIIDRVDGTIVECNTAYPGERDTTEKHIKLMNSHGWTKYFDVDIMDGEDDYNYINWVNSTEKKDVVVFLNEKIFNSSTLEVEPILKNYSLKAL